MRGGKLSSRTSIAISGELRCRKQSKGMSFFAIVTGCVVFCVGVNKRERERKNKEAVFF